MKASDAKYIEQLKKENADLKDRVSYLSDVYRGHVTELSEVYANKDKLIAERNHLYSVVRAWMIEATQGMTNDEADQLLDRVRNRVNVLD